MKTLFHSIAVLSIGGLAAPGAVAATATSPDYGRWTVNQDKPVFTAKGLPYKTIDVAPCGRDCSGVSVGAKGQCGPVLFRFLAKHADSESTLFGHAKRGTATRNVQIATWKVEPGEWPGGHELDLYVGDGHDFGDRSENMPKFRSEYKQIGNAHCTAR